MTRYLYGLNISHTQFDEGRHILTKSESIGGKDKVSIPPTVGPSHFTSRGT